MQLANLDLVACRRLLQHSYGVQVDAYGVQVDATNKKIRIAETTAIESLKRFVKAVVEVFKDEYLRSPNDNDTARLLALGEKRGFTWGEKRVYRLHALEVEKICIAKSTAIESLKRFVKAVVEVFEDEYLRSPNDNDTTRLLALGEKRGFTGMLGSIDCMHWKWKSCPSAWQGMYSGHVHKPTIILEAVASHDLWIWHAFFGLPGSHNDINVLHRSPLFAKLAEGQAPKVSYSINGHDYTMVYYLADGIYPSWATFVKSIPEPQGSKRKYFTKSQESVRKDVERAFGVLQARLAIVRGPARFWDEVMLGYIMKVCVIMHNMIIEDEGKVDTEERFESGGENITPSYDLHLI